MTTTWAMPPRAADPRVDYEVAVIGAGIGGIGAGIKLKQAGLESFVVLERAADLGGTWRDNTYPGVAVDITSLTYSFSFEPNPDWSRVFAPGAELQAYLRHCADKYGLGPHFRFGVAITTAAFDPAVDAWRLTTGGGEVVTARYVIAATGGLTQPKLPDIAGLETFAGRTVHTARWDHACDLSRQRVGVIGTGASAVQVIPAIAPVVKQLHVFQRTPIWIVPKPDAEIPAWVRQLFRQQPVTQASARVVATALTELVMVLSVVYNRQAPWVVQGLEHLCRAHLRRQVPDPGLQARLTPRYGFGCKRPSFSNDYWRTFNRPNVELVTDPIERITPTGLQTRDGRAREIDVLVLATGFRVFEKGNIPTFPVIGRNGAELGEFWHQHRYQAYEGASVPGFPNYFTILGPYAFTGSSWFAGVEAQTTHALRCIQEARRRQATCVEVRRDVHDAYFRDILRRQRNTVFFNNDCSGAHSYYFDHHGDAPFLRPSSGYEMLWHARHFDLDHYRYTTRGRP